MMCCNRKIALVGGIAVVALFLFLFVFSFLPGAKKGGSTIQQNGTESAKASMNKPAGTDKAAPRLNNDQISTLLLQWANNTRTDNDGYASGEDCDREGVCAGLVANNNVGGPAIWARYRFYLKSKNIEALEMVRKDIKTYVDSEKIITIQPYFWSCRLLYEMWQSPHLTQDEKYGLQTICARSLYNPIELTPQDDQFTSDSVLNQVVEDLSGERGDETFFTTGVETGKLEEYAVNASERAAIYAWGKDPSDLEQAQRYFVAAMHSLRKTTDTVIAADEAPMVGMAALDMNSVMPSDKLVTYAETVFGRYRNTPCSKFQSCVMRAYFYNELYKLKKKDEYLTLRNAILNKLYDERFDYQGTKGYFAGKQAFYDLGLNYYYDMIPNMMLAGLLTDM